MPISLPILNVMHEMSELLVQNCPNDLDSLDEHKHDTIQHIISNLSMCIQRRPGGKTPISDITLTGTPHYPNKSTELQMVGLCARVHTFCESGVNTILNFVFLFYILNLIRTEHCQISRQIFVQFTCVLKYKFCSPYHINFYMYLHLNS